MTITYSQIVRSERDVQSYSLPCFIYSKTRLRNGICPKLLTSYTCRSKSPISKLLIHPSLGLLYFLLDCFQTFLIFFESNKFTNHNITKYTQKLFVKVSLALWEGKVIEQHHHYIQILTSVTKWCSIETTESRSYRGMVL